MPVTHTPLFAWRNWLDESGATATCAQEDSAYPASNLREEDPSELVFQSANDDVDTVLVYDLGAARELGLYALAICNAQEADTHTFERSSNGTDWTEVTGTWGGVNDDREGEQRATLVFLPDAAATYRYFRHTWSGTNPDGVRRAARAFLAPAFQTTVGQAWGGYEIGVMQGPGRAHTIALEYEWLTENESLEQFLESLDYAIGQPEVERTPDGVQHRRGGGSLIVVLEPEEPTKWWRLAFWVFVAEKSAVAVPGYSQWKKSYTFEEIVP